MIKLDGDKESPPTSFPKQEIRKLGRRTNYISIISQTASNFPIPSACLSPVLNAKVKATLPLGCDKFCKRADKIYCSKLCKYLQDETITFHEISFPQQEEINIWGE